MDEGVGSLAPVLESIDVGFEPARRHHHALALTSDDAPPRCAAVERNSATACLQVLDFRVIGDWDSQLLSRVVIGVHHRLAVAQHEDVRPGQVERALEWQLPAHPVQRRPVGDVERFADH